MPLSESFVYFISRCLHFVDCNTPFVPILISEIKTCHLYKNKIIITNGECICLWKNDI